MLNLTKAADIMRRELFAPRGLSVPNIPIAWVSPYALEPSEEARTTYRLDRPAMIELSDREENHDPVRAAAGLAHELAHVAAQPVFKPEEILEFHGHPAHWRNLAEDIGLTMQSPWYTVPGPKFVEFYNRHLAGVADA